ncbi:MAG: VOC family protein [Deltaproteobacteria bacterium HGW-Deltaproteobacteria-12]|nr:MAG: VOC family protein [Deltaproteobacteria bacterium HGW-Deltaproteobacteria-12]
MENYMENHLHHVHVFAADLNRSIKFYEDYFNGEVFLDMDLAGARNVFMKVGRGRIHFYDQPPRISGRGSIHHFGIQTDDIQGVVAKMKAGGIVFKKNITDAGFWRYIMVPAPDDILIELFEVDKGQIPAAMINYFEWEQ